MCLLWLGLETNGLGLASSEAYGNHSDELDDIFGPVMSADSISTTSSFSSSLSSVSKLLHHHLQRRGRWYVSVLTQNVCVYEGCPPLAPLPTGHSTQLTESLPWSIHLYAVSINSASNFYQCQFLTLSSHSILGLL